MPACAKLTLAVIVINKGATNATNITIIDTMPIWQGRK
ncbi:MAG: hypothetical protein JW841_13200 [Deltaproteobacteria bacterium]|nr:hypothetical protein [Deltaproteobacteria bacterium]